VYHGRQILNTSTDVGYDILATCIFSVDETINLRDLKRQIHSGLEMLPSQFNISISARINTAPVGLGGFFYSLFGVISDEIWGIIKITTPYQLPGYKTLELVVESEPISSFDYYDPTGIPENSNSVMTEERTHSRVPVQNMDVNMNMDEEEEE
jgi:hypothetical protein